MNTKLVSYDLRDDSRKYDDLYTYLETFSGHHRINESLWMVNTDLTPAELRDNIGKHVDDKDRIFVSVIGSASAWNRSIEEFKSDIIHES